MKLNIISKKTNSGRSGEYKKDYMRIKFNSDDDLPLNKILKFHMLTIIVRSFFEEDVNLSKSLLR